MFELSSDKIIIYCDMLIIALENYRDALYVGFTIKPREKQSNDLIKETYQELRDAYVPIEPIFREWKYSKFKMDWSLVPHFGDRKRDEDMLTYEHLEHIKIKEAYKELVDNEINDYLDDIDRVKREAERQLKYKSSNNKHFLNNAATTNNGAAGNAERRTTSRGIHIDNNIDNCYATVLDDGICVIQKCKDKSHICLQKRLLIIIKSAFSDALDNANTEIESIKDIEIKEAAVNRLLNKEGLYLLFTHDSIRKALNDFDRSKDSNKQDIYQLRKSVTFVNNVNLIGEYDLEKDCWVSTVRFKLNSASELDLPFSPKACPYYDIDDRNIHEK